MRNYLVILVVLAMLSGCAVQDLPDTTDETTVETTDPGSLEPDSLLEQQTNGAVRQYSLGGGEYHSLLVRGGVLLLGADTEKTVLTALTGERGITVDTKEFSVNILKAGFCQTDNGFVYYDPEEEQAVFMNYQMQETKRLPLPEDIEGNPTFSPDGNEIYYCVGQQIRVLDVNRGISRLMKSHICTEQTLLGIYFDGQVLACNARNEQGQWNTLYISTQTGETLKTDGAVTLLDTDKNNFFALRMDGIVEQKLFGTLEGASGQLNLSADAVFSAISLGGAVGCDVEDSGLLRLSLYAFSTGKKTASIELIDIGMPQAVVADGNGECLWILTKKQPNEEQQLLRWDVRKSPIEEETVYTAPVYTAQTPDRDGLDACQDRVDALNAEHGITIRIWERAVSNSGGFTLEPEHQVPAVDKTLDELELVLSLFPDNFLHKSVNTRIRICVVRSIDSKTEAVQYWQRGDAFVVLAVGSDVRSEFTKAMGSVIDSHILGNSSMYDEWESLNPEGFVYGDETTYSRDNLTGEFRAFYDESAMTSVAEDRRSIFWQAMQEDNEELFHSEVMQKKLRLLCMAIRDSWDLKWKSEMYPWETYLAEPVAYSADK